MAEFDADELGKRLEQLNREQLAEREQESARLLRELESYRPGPKRADGTDGNETQQADRPSQARKRRRAR